MGLSYVSVKWQDLSTTVLNNLRINFSNVVNLFPRTYIVKRASKFCVKRKLSFCFADINQKVEQRRYKNEREEGFHLVFSKALSKDCKAKRRLLPCF